MNWVLILSSSERNYLKYFEFIRDLVLWSSITLAFVIIRNFIAVYRRFNLGIYIRFAAFFRRHEAIYRTSAAAYKIHAAVLLHNCISLQNKCSIFPRLQNLYMQQFYSINAVVYIGFAVVYYVFREILHLIWNTFIQDSNNWEMHSLSSCYNTNFAIIKINNWIL